VLVRVNEGDRLVEIALTDNKTKDLLLVTAQGMAIRFKEEEVRPMGLVAAGVNGIKLYDGDEVVAMGTLPAEGEIFLLTTDGKAKRVDPKDFPMQGRYGKGVIAWDIGDKVRLAGAVVDKPNHMATIHMTRGAPKSTRLDAAGVRKRASTKGDTIVEVKPGEEVLSINVGWTVEKFQVGSNGRANGHKGDGGKKNGRVKPAAVEKVKKASPRSPQGGKVKKAPARAKAPAAKGRKPAAKAKTPKKKKR
jgi:hypothetical protein